MLYNALRLRNFGYFVLCTVDSRPSIPWKWKLHVLCAECFSTWRRRPSASLKANEVTSRGKGSVATYLRRVWRFYSGIIAGSARVRRWESRKKDLIVCIIYRLLSFLGRHYSRVLRHFRKATWLDRQHSGRGNNNGIGRSPDLFFPCGEKWSGNETRPPEALGTDPLVVLLL